MGHVHSCSFIFLAFIKWMIHHKSSSIESIGHLIHFHYVSSINHHKSSISMGTLSRGTGEGRWKAIVQEQFLTRLDAWANPAGKDVCFFKNRDATIKNRVFTINRKNYDNWYLERCCETGLLLDLVRVFRKMLLIDLLQFYFWIDLTLGFRFICACSDL